MYHPFRLLVRCMLVCMSALLLTSCYYSHPNQTDHWAEASEGAVDSVSFYISHHYWIGYNFQTTDSLQLNPLPPQIGVADYAISPQRMSQVRKHDDLVVGRIQYVPADTVDSVWVKVARDQLTQGWVRESVLLAKVVPNDPISKFIYHFSGRTTGFVLLFLGLAVLFRPYSSLSPQALPHGPLSRHTQFLSHFALSHGQCIRRPLRQYSVLCAQYLG